MPTATDPAPSTLVNGTTPSGEDVNLKTYFPSALGTFDSLEGINGELDRVNLLTSSVPIPKSKVMVGAASRSGSVGATANVDFIGDLLYPVTSAVSPHDMAGWTNAKQKDQNHIDKLEPFVVPGLSDTIINPFTTASRIRLSWSVDVVPSTWASLFQGGGDSPKGTTWGDGAGGWGLSSGTPIPTNINSRFSYGSLLFLYVNGVQHPNCRVRVTTGSSTMVPSQNYTLSPCNNTGSWNDFFHWEFSCVLDTAEVAKMGLGANNPLLRGEHTVSIRAWTAARILRFKTRSLHWTVVN